MIKQNINDKPIGILGGTFNPIHHGHLRVALELYERLDFTEVRLIPSAYPPHREQPSVSSQCRLEMVQAAIMDIEGLRVDDRELWRDGPSYMVDTLSSLRNDHPYQPLCLILGMDAFLGLPNWYKWKRLITLAHFVIVNRSNIKLSKAPTMQKFFEAHQASSLEDLTNQIAGALWLEEIPTLNISASQIRSYFATGKNPCYLLPQSVLNIINTHQLYH